MFLFSLSSLYADICELIGLCWNKMVTRPMKKYFDSTKNMKGFTEIFVVVILKILMFTFA